MPEIEGDDSNGVSSNEPFVLQRVVQNKREHAFNMIHQIRFEFTIQRKNDLAITACLIGIRRCFLTDVLVVIDFAVYGQCRLMFWVNEWL